MYIQFHSPCTAHRVPVERDEWGLEPLLGKPHSLHLLFELALSAVFPTLDTAFPYGPQI